MYVCVNVCLFPLSLQKPPDVTPQKKTGSAKRCEKKLKNEPSSVTAETLPGGLQVVDFAEARATELQCLLKAVADGKENISEASSSHETESNMTDNVRGLPRRLREKIAKEVCVCVCVMYCTVKKNCSGSSSGSRRSHMH